MIVIHLLLLMARKGLYSASGPTKAKITKQPGKKKSNIATASLETLKKVRKKTRVKYSHAKKTCGNYNGHFCHGQKFFAELVSDICSTLLSPPESIWTPVCYDFVITQVVIRQSFDSTFIFDLRYKVYSGKAKLQF